MVRVRPHFRLLVAVVIALLGAPLVAEDASQDARDEAALERAEAEGTFLDAVTVTATRSETALKDTPGQIDVVGAEEIEQLGYTNVGDLVRFTPGVCVDGDVTRLGFSGFNIRGIGGNRVLTQVDGVPVAEQFDFGPFSVTQYSVDIDALEQAEIVRSAGSALYGSDALGGVVALETRGPRSYLGDDNRAFRLRVGYDDRAGEVSETGVVAFGNDRWQASLLYSHRDGEALDNQGTVDTADRSRTRPNPIDRTTDNALFKVNRSSGNGSNLELALEWYDSEAETQVLSSQGPGSPFSSAVLDFDAVDTQDRLRLSIEQSMVPRSVLVDALLWRAYYQDAETDQVTDELRQGSLGPSDRDGLVSFAQETFGVEAQFRKGFGNNSATTLTYGLSLRRDQFDQLRDRSEVVIATGAPVPTSLIFPTKYFPESDVDETGAFVQAELGFFDDRLRVVPGVRYDRYDLDANENDQIFVDGNPGTGEPADLADEAVSPKLGLVWSFGNGVSAFAQYAGGFRAPPMSAVNNGFTNQAGGYRTLANPDLEAETSDNFEVGLRGAFRRGSFSIVAFDNRYEDFIETIFLGFNPQIFLVEFQPQNLDEVSISGFELGAEVRFGRGWRARAAYSLIEGDNETADEPLDSIAPNRLVAGLRYLAAGGRWGVEGVATLSASKSASDLPSASTQFRTPSYEVLDLAAWWAISERFTLQLSGWNLTDETYWQWANVRGQAQGSATIDRYTSPGRSVGLQARVNF